MDKITIETGLGKIIGTVENGVCMYRGIPYAVTERFRVPRDYPKWDVFDATGIETDCYQYLTYRDESQGPDAFYHKEFRSNQEFRFDESPMTMNIIVKENAVKHPVLVFIHGGGFETGTVGELPYGTCTEYAKHDVLFVSLGYRLNVFSLYETGNYGLHDMVFGLKWIRKHIKDFGGDPDRITIMGQSAGAMSIMNLMYTQTLKDIVKGAILMSGAGTVPRMTGPWTKEQAKPFWANVRKRAGVRTTEEFRKLPAEVIWNAWYDESRENWSFQAVQPGIDGKIIPKQPQKVVRERSYLDVPMIVGVTSQDFMPYIIYDMAIGWAMKHVRHGRAPVYGYMFDRALPGNSFRAFHGSDLWYMFGNMDKCWRPFKKIDYQLKDLMVHYVANFVKHGTPNGDGLPYWRRVSRRSRAFRHFDGHSKGMITPLQCRRKMDHTFLRDKGPM
ncbi:MAG: carboxylesterase family protein [Mogibacterium sp.]|nr:carboxylesterase family protein [Mogibacterium sp.]